MFSNTKNKERWESTWREQCKTPMQFKGMMLQFWSEHEINKLRFLKTHLDFIFFKYFNDHINVHEKTT
jgi:hypothetical protein